mgnify:CR=1 FL=1
MLLAAIEPETVGVSVAFFLPALSCATAESSEQGPKPQLIVATWIPFFSFSLPPTTSIRGGSLLGGAAASSTVNVRVDPSAVQQLYRTVGSRWASILVQPRVLNFFKEETVKYTSTDIAPKREQIRVSVRDRLKQELAPYSITVEDVLIDNIDFRAEFKQAIEAKNIATQNALEAQNRVAQKEAEAKQAIATANGAAAVVKIQAEAQANANKLLAESLTPELIQYQYVTKLAPNARVILLPSGTPFLLNSDMFDQTTPEP